VIQILKKCGLGGIPTDIETQLPKEMKKKYRILSLYGGGTWALLQAKALGEFHGLNTSGKEILKCYDFVAANSGGSLVLAALLENMSPRAILQFFCNECERRKIFCEKWYSSVTRSVDNGPRYSASAKLTGIKSVFPTMGNKNLSEIGGIDGIPHLLIMGYDYDRNRAAFFRSNVNSLAASPGLAGVRPDITLAEAVHASSNAPINFFDKPAQVNFGYMQRRMWDGAVGGYNNPCLAAVVEAIANKIPTDQISLVSIGTGTVILPIDNPKDTVLGVTKRSVLFKDLSKTCFTDDVERMATAILDDPPEAASYITFLWLQGQQEEPDRVVRISPMLSPIWDDVKKSWSLPNGLSEDKFKMMSELQMDAVDQNEVDLIDKLGNLWLSGSVLNQLIRTGPRLECDLG